MKERFEAQLAFLKEIDQMKQVFRRTYLIDGTRLENDAEHSWHFAVTAMVLYEYAEEEVNLPQVLKMALVHDLVEVYAGDTFAYDTTGYESKEQREQEAADKLFGILPEDQQREFRALWEEFEAMDTVDAKYAAAMDRLQPIVNNYYSGGMTWKGASVTREMVYQRMAIVRDITPRLWPFVEMVVDFGFEKGYLIG